MKQTYSLESARSVVLKSNATMDADNRITYVSGTLSLRVLGAIDYLTSQHSFRVRSSQPK